MNTGMYQSVRGNQKEKLRKDDTMILRGEQLEASLKSWLDNGTYLVRFEGGEKNKVEIFREVVDLLMM